MAAEINKDNGGEPTPTPTPTHALAPQPPKKCPGCGHNSGQEHEKNCLFRGTVTDAVAV